MPTSTYTARVARSRVVGLLAKPSELGCSSICSSFNLRSGSNRTPAEMRQRRLDSEVELDAFDGGILDINGCYSFCVGAHSTGRGRGPRSWVGACSAASDDGGRAEITPRRRRRRQLQWKK
jgi:hypothetical protein